MAFGDDYQAVLAKYKALPFSEQAALSGFNYGGVDESGQPIWTRADGQGLQPNTDAGQTLQGLVQGNTKFDGQKYFNNLGIIPTNPQLTGDGSGQDSYTPEQARAAREQMAKSYKFPDYATMLNKMTGGGQFINDPQLGEVFVPNNRDFQTWDKSFVGATSRGGGLFGALNKFADSGGLVKAIGGVIGGAGLSDLWGNFFNGATPPTGSTVPGDSLVSSTPPTTPDPSWGVNPQTPPGPMSTISGQYVDPNTLQMVGGAPVSTTGTLASNSLIPTTTASIGSTPFSLDDFVKNRPTTGNKLVDSAIEKAATTALTSTLAGANQATAGEGGDTTAADQQAADEARKKALIDQINAMYDPNNFTDEEGKLSDAIRGQQGDALKLGYDKAARATTFDAARRGNVGGSVMADNIAGLNRDNQLGATKIEDAVNSALSGLRSARLSSQGNAISLVNAGSGPEGVNAAATGIKNAIDSATAAKVPDVTQGLFQNVALSNQAINTGNNTAALGAYINARTSGGGSLFPLGNRAAGYSVPT